MGNTVLKNFIANGSWVAPAGVKSVRITITDFNRTAIAHGGTAVFPLAVGGRAFAMGQNSSGHLGTGDVTPRSSPVAVLGGLFFSKLYPLIDSATDAIVGITREGVAYAWGANSQGQLGNGDLLPRSSPVAVLGNLTFQKFATSEFSVLGLSTSGKAYAMGLNTNYTLGVGDNVNRSSPVAVLGNITFTDLAITKRSAMGLSTTGVAYGWGGNGHGQLGVGDVVNRSSPVAVLGGLTFAKLYLGAEDSGFTKTHVIGVTAAGVAYAWGSNDNGQLGVGDTNKRSSPVAVLGGIVFDPLSFALPTEQGSVATTIGLTKAGVAYAWGNNDKGVLGVGNTTNRSSPVAVLGGLTFSKVLLRYSSAYGLTKTGALYAWGENTNGQLGVGDVVARSSPVAVLGGLTFVDIWVGNAALFALGTDGVLYTMGANANGQLGLGDVLPRSSPVAVLGNIQFMPAPTTFNVTVPVTPGTTYNILLKQFNVMFGLNLVAQGDYDLLTLSYDN